MMDLGTLQAHIKLEGADGFKSDLQGCAAAAKTVESTIKGLKTSLGGIASSVSGGISTAIGGMKTAFSSVKTVVSGVANAVQKIGSVVAEVASKVKDLLVGAFHAVRNAALAVAAATMAIGTGITKMVMDNYAQTEQLAGGIETLYGKSADTVIKNADKAFKTAGMSANEYMDNAITMANSLVQDLGGDTEQAAKYADMAIQDMSDNANKIGTDVKMVENAYQGFARGEFRMLDNLRLGYGGTREEMQRLLKDAGEITGKVYDINSMADIIEAIHTIQTEIGITGTTAEEAAHTIEGSTKAMKASWKNLLSGLADPKGRKQIWRLVGDFTNAFDTMLDNVLPAIDTVADNMGDVIEGLGLALPKMTEKIRPTLRELAKNITAELPNMVAGVGEVVLSAFSATGRGILAGMPDFFNNLSTNLEGLVPRLRKTFNAFKANIGFNGEDIITSLGTAWDTLTGEGGVLSQAHELVMDIGDWIKVKVENLDLEGAGAEVGKQIEGFIETGLPTVLDGISWTLGIGSKIMGGIVDELNGENDEMGSGVDSTALGQALSTCISSAAGFIVISAEAASNLAVSLLDAIGTQLGIVDENGNTAGIESIKTGLGKVFTGLKSSDFETSLEGVGDTLIGAIQFTGTAVGNLFKNLFNIPDDADFSDIMGSIGDTIAGAITFTSDNTRAVLSKLLTIDNINEGLEGIEEFASGVARGITDAICSAITSGDALQIVGSLMYAIATIPIEIITGLIDGMLEALFGDNWEYTSGLINQDTSTPEKVAQQRIDNNRELNQLLEQGQAHIEGQAEGWEKVVDAEGQVLAYRSESGDWTPTFEGAQVIAELQQANQEAQKLTGAATEISKAYQQAGNATQKVAEDTEKTADNAEKAKESISKVSEQSQETKTAISDAVKSTGAVSRNTEEMADGAKKAQEAYTEAANQLERMNQISGYQEDRQISGQVQSGNGPETTEGSGVVLAEGVEQQATERISNLKDALNQQFAELGINLDLSPVGEGIATKMKESISTSMETFDLNESLGLDTKLDEMTTNLQTSMEAKAPEIMTSFQTGLQTGFDGSVSSWLSNLGTTCATAVGSLASTLIGKGTELMSGFLNGITSGWSAVQSYLAGTAGRCQAAVGDLSGTLYGAGVALMQGLANGIIAAASSAAAAAAAAVGQVVAAARSAAGIASPSKVFFEIGEFLDKGLELGILNGIDGVIEAVDTLSLGTQNAFHPELAYASGYKLPTASSSVGTQYSIYIDNARVNDDEQIRTRFEDLMIEMARKGMM